MSSVVSFIYGAPTKRNIILFGTGLEYIYECVSVFLVCKCPTETQDYPRESDFSLLSRLNISSSFFFLYVLSSFAVIQKSLGDFQSLS